MTSLSSGSVFVSPGSTDDGLLEGIRANDATAWEQFFDRYSPLVYVWCRKCELQPADALDVSQQVFQAVDRSIGRFSRRSEGGSFRGWLFVITKNLVRNYLQRTLRGPRALGGSSIQRRLLDEPDTLDEPSLSAIHRSDDGTSGPHSPLEKILDLVRDDFDDSTWQCFHRMVIEGHRAIDVGEDLGMRPAAVRQAKYRVTKRLRTELGGSL
ncbi:RNA polymerase sigma factor [Rhodopirellula sp. JC639]|uniref:RNA polymerase sigma factor n=1 Tax=Stieleria mannarensis TaxID=2755585 RepID=UPI001601CEE2|nr:sigma-70 family RNA polymerase sigma factor [Rhodopirellula sp. JC639]